MEDELLLEEIVMAAMLVAMDQGKTNVDDIKADVDAAVIAYGHSDKLAASTMILNAIFGEFHPDSEYVMGLGGDFRMTQRGREVVDMAKRKLDVNELIGEDSIDLDKEDVERIKKASENLPG